MYENRIVRIEEIMQRYPPPYRVEDGYLCREMTGNNGAYQNRLCNFLPYVKEEITVDDGAECSHRLVIGGYLHDGTELPDAEIGGSELKSFDWVIEKWGASCIISVGASVREHIRYALQYTAEFAEKKTVYAVTGWKLIDGQWHYLLPGDGQFDVSLSGKLSSYGTVSKSAEKEDLAALLELIDHPPAPKEIIYPLIAFTFLSPLNEFLRLARHEPKFVLMLQGRTGTKKSTLAALFLSFFGRFTASELPLSFRDTANSILQSSYLLKDVLTCIDDFHPGGRIDEKDLTRTAQMVMRAYGDRVGRGRLTSDSRLMESRPPQGNAIITAEYPPVIGESGAARYFLVEIGDGDVDLKLLSEYQDYAERGLFRRVMKGFTEWITAQYLSASDKEKEFISFLKEQFVDNRKLFRSKEIARHDRVPENAAWLQLGFEMVLKFLSAHEIISESQSESLKNEFTDIISAIVLNQSDSVEDSRPTHIFIRKLFALTESGQAVLLPKDSECVFPPTNHIGYYDDEYLYLFSEIAHKAVKKLCEEQGEAFSITCRGLVKALTEEKLIEPDKKQSAKTIRFNRVPKKVICLLRSRANEISDSYS